MTDFYLEIDAATDDAFDDVNPRPSPSVLVAEYNDQRCYLYSADDVTAWPSVTILGAWDRSTGLQAGQSYSTDSPAVIQGTPTHPIQSNYWDYVRPLGNDTGRATGPLRTLRWQGQPEVRYAVDDVSEYPVTDAPFQLKITREEITAPDPFPGWGWTVEMISDDPARDITARAVGIYSDPECTAFLYTTGAFIQDGSNNNNYYTECPAGQRTNDPDQVNFALLLGAAQEGFFNLPEGSSTTEAFFWAKDQGSGGIEEWSGLSVAYAVDHQVTYQGSTYTCLQAHTSQPAWNPPAVPALWQLN